MAKNVVAELLDKVSEKSGGKMGSKDAESGDEEPGQVALEGAVAKFFSAGKAGDNAKAAAALKRAVSLCGSGYEDDDED